MFLLLRLKQFGYSASELRHLYNSLPLPVMTYGICVWGGARKGLLDKIDLVQKRAVRYGIIDQFGCIQSIVKHEDAKLFKSASTNDHHPLRSTVPNRSCYSERKLRKRLPPCSQATLEKTLSIFPNRYLRNSDV